MMKSIKDFNLSFKNVLARCDFNVPINEKGEIEDDFRIKQSFETINYLREHDAKVILMSHLGKPKGKITDNLRLGPIASCLSHYLGIKVLKSRDSIGRNTENQIKKLKPKEVLLLENLRFHKGEEKNSPDFAKELSKLKDIYINDAFSVSHRSHASVCAITDFLPSGAGFSLEKEISALSLIIKSPKRPLVLVIGGSKIEDKMAVINRFLKISDYILIGGKTGEEFKNKKEEINQLTRFKAKIILPRDELKEKNMILDIGPLTIKSFSEIISKAKTILWAGPMGKFEQKKFEKGTKQIAQAISKNKNAYKVAGGGDTIFALNKFGFSAGFNHLSTGGGAMLDFLSGKQLPGLKALSYYS